MKTFVKSFSIVALLILSLMGTSKVYGQEVRQVKITKHLKFTKHVIDSIMRIEHDRAKRKATPARDSVLRVINALPAATAGTLTYKGYYFDSLPDLSRFYQITGIDFSDNDIRGLSESDFSSPLLRSVNLKKNHISVISFPKNDSVKFLDLSGNDLKEVPRSIRNLKNLEILGLANNEISRVPHFLKRMKHLKEIDLGGNKLSHVKGSYLRRLSRIQKVLMMWNHITKLPHSMGRMRHTVSLNFSNNDLASLPKQFGRLKNVEHILFYRNKFTSIPSCVFKLKKLKELDFYYNRIDSIPPQISQLSDLEQLYLSYNNIRALPQSMEKLSHLKYIYVHNNKLKFLPAWVSKLPSLQRIGLGNNELMQIPDFSGLPLLTDLDLHGNDIDRFPWKMLDSKTIKLLYIQNNPFILSSSDRDMLTKMRNELLKKGVVLNY